MPNFKLVFADWRARPGRSETWREERRLNFADETMWRREYPETLADVLLAAEDMVFSAVAIDKAQEDYFFPAHPVVGNPQHRYLKAWDVGRLQDAAVGVCLDITSNPHFLVDYRRLLKKPYPILQAEIADLHNRYPGPTYVEDNNAGRSVIENLDVPASPFVTSGSSKPKLILALKVALEKEYLKLPRTRLVSQLIFELQSYMWDDEGLIQDSVMALGIACHLAGPPLYASQRPTVADTVGRSAGLHERGAPRPTTSRAAPIIASGSRRGMRRGAQDDGQSRDAKYL